MISSGSMTVGEVPRAVHRAFSGQRRVNQVELSPAAILKNAQRGGPGGGSKAEVCGWQQTLRTDGSPRAAKPNHGPGHPASIASSYQRPAFGQGLRVPQDGSLFVTGTARGSPKSISSKPKGQREEQMLQKLQVKVPRHSAQGHETDLEDVFQPQPGRAQVQVESGKLAVDNERAAVSTQWCQIVEEVPSVVASSVDLEAFGLLDSILKAETDLATPAGEDLDGNEGGRAMPQRQDAAKQAVTAVAFNHVERIKTVLQTFGVPDEPVPELDLSPLPNNQTNLLAFEEIKEKENRRQSCALAGNEEVARALYASELRKNKQLKQLLADQGAILAAGPNSTKNSAISTRGRRLEESLDGSAKRSQEDHLALPQIIKQSKIMVELRGNDRAEIEAPITERRASGVSGAAGATTLYGGLYKEGITSTTFNPSSQRALPQASPRRIVGGARRVSSIEERDRPGEQRSGEYKAVAMEHLGTEALLSLVSPKAKAAAERRKQKEEMKQRLTQESQTQCAGRGNFSGKRMNKQLMARLKLQSTLRLAKRNHRNHSLALQQALNADLEQQHSVGELPSGNEAEETSKPDTLRSHRSAIGRLAQDSKRASPSRNSLLDGEADSDEKALAQKQHNSKIMVIGNKAHLARNRDVSPRGRPKGVGKGTHITQTNSTDHGCQADSAMGADSAKAPNRIEVKMMSGVTMIGGPEEPSPRGTVMKISSKTSLLQPQHPEGELQLQLRLMEAALFAPDLDLQVTGSSRRFVPGFQSKAVLCGPSGAPRPHHDSSPNSKDHDFKQARHPTDAQYDGESQISQSRQSNLVSSCESPSRLLIYKRYSNSNYGSRRALATGNRESKPMIEGETGERGARKADYSQLEIDTRRVENIIGTKIRKESQVVYQVMSPSSRLKHADMGYDVAQQSPGWSKLHSQEHKKRWPLGRNQLGKAHLQPRRDMLCVIAPTNLMPTTSAGEHNQQVTRLIVNRKEDVNSEYTFSREHESTPSQASPIRKHANNATSVDLPSQFSNINPQPERPEEGSQAFQGTAHYSRARKTSQTQSIQDLIGGEDQLVNLLVAAADVVEESQLESAVPESADRAPANLRSEASAEMLEQIKRLSKLMRMSRTSKLGQRNEKRSNTEFQEEPAEEPTGSFGGAPRVFRPLQPSRSPLRDRLLNGSAFRSGHRNTDPKSDPQLIHTRGTRDFSTGRLTRKGLAASAQFKHLRQSLYQQPGTALPSPHSTASSADPRSAFIRILEQNERVAQSPPDPERSSELGYVHNDSFDQAPRGGRSQNFSQVCFIPLQQQVELAKRMRYNYDRYKKQMAAAEHQLIMGPSLNSPHSLTHSHSTTRKKQVYYKQFQPRPELPRLELPSIGGSALDRQINSTTHASKADKGRIKIDLKGDEITEETLVGFDVNGATSKSPVDSRSHAVSEMPAVPSSALLSPVGQEGPRALVVEDRNPSRLVPYALPSGSRRNFEMLHRSALESHRSTQEKVQYLLSNT